MLRATYLLAVGVPAAVAVAGFDPVSFSAFVTFTALCFALAAVFAVFVVFSAAAVVAVAAVAAVGAVVVALAAPVCANTGSVSAESRAAVMMVDVFMIFFL